MVSYEIFYLNIILLNNRYFNLLLSPNLVSILIYIVFIFCFLLNLPLIEYLICSNPDIDGSPSSSLGDVSNEGSSPGPQGPESNPSPISSTQQSSDQDSSEDELCRCDHKVGEDCPSCTHETLVDLDGPPARCCICEEEGANKLCVSEVDCECVGHENCLKQGLDSYYPSDSFYDSSSDSSSDSSEDSEDTIRPSKKPIIEFEEKGNS